VIFNRHHNTTKKVKTGQSKESSMMERDIAEPEASVDSADVSPEERRKMEE
jgi:hypothetical protein